MATLFDSIVDNLVQQAKSICQEIETLPVEDQVEALNRIRSELHQVSPFVEEPVDCTLWVKAEQVTPNDYNPNMVYRPEMNLLKTSIREDHVTQPIVSYTPAREYDAGNMYEITDGEHRFITITTDKTISNRLRAYVPVSVINAKTREGKMAATIRHNRARGVHKLDSMTDIVLSMLGAGWTDDEIAAALGMDADEILRMKQVAGAAKAFERPIYNRAWINDDGQDTLD